MAYKALDIAKKLIFKAQNDEPNGGERLTNLKLQKLLYYQQGFHLAFFGTPLFAEDVEAWMYGPVVPAVYDEYSAYGSSALPEVKVPVSLSEDEEELFNEVYDAYREFSAIGLMNRTHSERPWLDAVPHDRGTVITQESMMAYFKTQIQ
ncbi:Panacea domain-containing protein [Segatella copri]|uniref:Panacea domain-containing protein n=1 Tax=Segatella copri TaxID=165179 RepID=UPI003F987B3A